MNNSSTENSHAIVKITLQLIYSKADEAWFILLSLIFGIYLLELFNVRGKIVDYPHPLTAKIYGMHDILTVK